MSDSTQHNPFTILGLKSGFDIDSQAIERSYLAKLAGAHPDAGGGDDMGDSCSFDAATLNNARSILLDDEQRAIALLDLLGGPNASACKELPDGFLMDIMSTRQEIEEHLADGGEQSRVHWEHWARDQRTQYAHSITDLFDQLSDPPSESQLIQIRVVLNAWRYIERLIEQLDPEYDPARADFR
jgi:molecular chaperone HscB